jgi:hypothetical protein
VTLHYVATAIELEASYKIWRARHERYWFLSRRAWLNSATFRDFEELNPRTAQQSIQRNDRSADRS